MRDSPKGAMGGSGAGRFSLRISITSPAFCLSLKEDGLRTVSEDTCEANWS